MRKSFVLLIVIAFVLSACGKSASKVDYKVAEDKTNNNTRYVRVVTDATSEADFKAIVDSLKKESKKFDALFVYIHDKEDEPFGNLKATATIAISQKGLALTGNNKKGTYTIEMK